jgi:hypothetical protein
MKPTLAELACRLDFKNQSKNILNNKRDDFS